MKKLFFMLCAGLLLLNSCNKSATEGSAISLSGLSTSIAVGQTPAVTANTSSNTLSWPVNQQGYSNPCFCNLLKVINKSSFNEKRITFCNSLTNHC